MVVSILVWRNVDYEDRDIKIEKEADDFAIQWTMSEEEEEDFVLSNDFSRAAIINYALEIGTHPSLIAGRLAKNRYLTYPAIVAMEIVPSVEIG